jgi:hypothetical protein
LILKFSTPVVTDGPTGTLSAEGADKSQSIYWAMVLEVDGAILTDSPVESEIWGGTTSGQTLLNSDSINYMADQNQSYTTLFSHQKEGKQRQVSLLKQWIPTKRLIKNSVCSFN